MDIYGERAEHLAAEAIRSATRALEGAEDRLADDHTIVLELLSAASAGIELARSALAETSNPDPSVR